MKIMHKGEIKLRHVMYLFMFIILLVAVRWIWYGQLSSPHQPVAVQGVLDLHGVDLEHAKPIILDGEWLFFPGQWMDESNRDEALDGQPLHVPGSWKAIIDPADKKAYGYGTYYLRIMLDRPLSDPISVRFQSIYTASEVEINGEVLARFGTLAEQWEGSYSETRSFLVTYAKEGQSELRLFVRASNYASPSKGGIFKSVQLGSQEKVEQIYLYSIGLQLVVCVIFLLHAMYALIIYLMNVRKTEFITFFLMMVAATLTVAVQHNGLLFKWIDADFMWSVKLNAFAFMWFSFFLFQMGRTLMGIKRKGKGFYSYFLLLVAYTLFYLFGPAEMMLYSHEKGFYMLLYYIPLCWTAYYFARMVLNKGVGALFLLFSTLCVLNNILWGLLYYKGAAQFLFYPLDLIAVITSFSTYWFKRYFYNSHENIVLNAQLAEVNRLKDRFLANTSHELRTPLHGIMNIAQSVLARKKHMLDEQSQHDMELLIMVSRRMSHMVNDLLDVVRLQDKRVKVQMSQVHIQSVAAGVLDMLRFLTEGSTQVELRMSVESDLPSVFADEERLVQILINLLHNALKHTQVGSVELIAEQDNGHVWIHIKDSGAGMDEAMQKRAFMPYEQGTFGSGGMGLGLSICKDLVELHDSKLLVQSQPGKGSIFSFKLAVFDEKLNVKVAKLANNTEKTTGAQFPAAAQARAEMAAMVATGLDVKEADHISRLAEGGDRIRVLAVDDDPVNLKVLTHILTSETYHIEMAYSALEALDKLHHEPWDLVIADVMMPDISGYELTRLIRERFTLYELPIILLTARSEPEDIYAGFLAGANDYVTKPVDAMELRYRAGSLSSLKQAVGDRLRMEAAYLQAQIHPHFLFNTLNSILALSDIDAEKMRNLADAFTDYLRISFSFLTVGKMVPLSRELELVENYLYIEQQRFEERLQVEWEVNADPELLIPPLTIQPLVENAVRHGILSQARGGTLRIRIERLTDATYFYVMDTGLGIDDEQITRLLSPAGTKQRGIGLFNTHSRLTRLFGKGIQIQSKLGEGTTVSFSIPHR